MDNERTEIYICPITGTLCRPNQPDMSGRCGRPNNAVGEKKACIVAQEKGAQILISEKCVRAGQLVRVVPRYDETDNTVAVFANGYYVIIESGSPSEVGRVN
jgi:hypothetical protein